MMWSIRGGAGCAKLRAGNAALPAASAIPPATNSRRRIVYLVRSFQKLSGMAGLSRCNEAANSHGKETRSAYGMLMPSIRIFGEDRLDAAVPGAVKLFQELFGRRDTARDVFLDRTQIASLVLAASVQPPTPRKSLLCQRDRRLSQVQHVVPRDPSREAYLRHIVAQFLALLGSPILDEIPGSLEGVVIVENPGPVGWQSRQPAPRTAVRATHFEIALEPHFREDRGDVVCPVGDRGALAREAR